MILDTLEVEGFGCVVKARVELGPGLNVLYGPNDLGKSTLAQAVRAALLLQHKSKEHERFKPWHADLVPTVRLAFRGTDGKHWRVKKTFDYGARGSSVLEWSPDGTHWSPDKKSREVDGELRKMLGWGVGEVGGRSGQKGFPRSFLATALLGEHADVEAVFARDLGIDADEGGRSRLTEALQALAEDPRFKSVLLRVSEKVDEAKTATGKWRTGRDSPMFRIRERIAALQVEIEELGKAALTSEEVVARFAELESQRREIDEALASARTRAAALGAARASGARWREADARVTEASARLASITEECARVRELESGVATLQDTLARAQGELAGAEARLREADEQDRAARAALRLATDGDADAARERQDLEHRVRTLELELAETDRTQRDLVAAIERIRDCEVRLAEAERAAIDAAALRAQAARHRDTAARAREASGLTTFPDADALASLRALERALEMAEARVSLGVAVRVVLETPLELHVATDGGARRKAKGETSFTAERGLSLELGSVGRIDVAVGDEAARTELESARARWRDAGEPVLARCGVDSIAALERAIAKGEEHRRGADREELAAVGAEARAGALDGTAATVLDRRAEVERCRVALEAISSDVRDADPVERIASRRKTIEEALSTARASLLQVQARAVEAMERATAASTASASMLTSATAARDAAVASVASTRDRLAADRARLDEITRRCTPAHEEAARAELAAAQAILAGIPRPDELVDDDAVAAADAALASLVTKADEITTELHKTEGMLEQVGGGVVKEKEERTRAALDDAKRHESELYLEYEAWELLRDTLKKVEAVEGHHLGHALAQAIEKNLSAVTKGRYARFEMDRDLKTRGLQASGEARPIELLSQGLKEQVATLVRLAIAQQLESVVILDDQLAQTDIERVEFFRELLREIAKDVQIVVLTCRPLDYLGEHELPAPDDASRSSENAAVKSIDLERVIERAPVVAR